MSSFEVTTDELHAFASRLSTLLGELDQVTGQLHGEDSSAAGAPELESSISGFLADWSRGLDDVRTALSTLADRVGGAGGSYDTVDRNVAGHFVTR
jgi:uncharacterized protein YukE